MYTTITAVAAESENLGDTVSDEIETVCEQDNSPGHGVSGVLIADFDGGWFAERYSLLHEEGGRLLSI